MDYPDPHRINIDLHNHTTASDGTLTATELIHRAAKNQVNYLAITDHDDTQSLTLARLEAARIGIGFIPGVEISVTFCGQTIHIVGLGINEQDPHLSQGLANIRTGRDTRAQRIDDDLAAHGIQGSLAGALQYAGNPKLVSRTHFARHFVAAKYCDTMPEVFQKYLTKGKPGYVSHDWATLSQAISWIHHAGGVAVIAHPGRYRFNATERWALFSEFKDLGGQAIEVVTGSHTIAQYTEYAKLAVEFDFAASRGSDFHSPQESRIDVGQLPELPSICTPIWSRYPELLTHTRSC
jgi:3',5'-nucleoside bisphosphate phosphatase